MTDRARIVVIVRVSRAIVVIVRSSIARAGIATATLESIGKIATSTARAASAPKDGWTGTSIPAASAARIATAGIARATAGITEVTAGIASPTGRAATMRTTAGF